MNAECGARSGEGETEKQENVFVLFVSFVVRQPLERRRRDERGARSTERGMKRHSYAGLRTPITNGTNVANGTNAFWDDVEYAATEVWSFDQRCWRSTNRKAVICVIRSIRGIRDIYPENGDHEWHKCLFGRQVWHRLQSSAARRKEHYFAMGVNRKYNTLHGNPR